MSNDIYHFIKKLALIEGRITPTGVKKGLNAQQKGVPQLPALFKMQDQSPVLGGKVKPHPAGKYMVGDDIDVAQTPLEETMKNVEEDVLNKVRKDLTTYLDMLADKQKADKELVAKAKHDIENDNPTEEIEEDPTELEVGTDPMPTPTINPSMPESACIKRIPIDECGMVFEIHGDENRGFEIRCGDKVLPTRFKDFDHAVTATDMFRAHRKSREQHANQDYVDEA